MAGKAIGVVLSGGGSRGLAHLGVLQALDAAGIPIDVIGGTSQVWPSLNTGHYPRLHVGEVLVLDLSYVD